MSNYRERITALSPEQRKLLEWRLKQEGIDSARIQIPRQPPERAAFPLSFSQQRLWFLDQLMPGSPFYNLGSAWRLHGPLEQEALERSFWVMVERHATLRTRIVPHHGQAQQLVGPADQAATFTLARHDLQHLPAAERAEAAERLARDAIQQPFDLAARPLLRAGLACLGPHEHVLYVIMHHLISDGWSMSIFLQELVAGYVAETRGAEGAAARPDLPIQYGDFTVWQREWLAGPILETQLAYWKTQLHALPTLELPADRPRPPVQTFRGARATFHFPPALAEGLRALCLHERVTTFMLLLAAFDVLLARYSGQDDIAVGTPIAGRHRGETEKLIGFFVNTLVLRADLSGNPTFRELLGRVRQATLSAYNHQDLPFEKLVEELQPTRDLSRTPLFQVMFVLHNVPPTNLRLEDLGLLITDLNVDSGTTNFDLMLNLSEEGPILHGWLTYSTDMFDAPTIERLLGHYRALMEQIIADPDQRVCDLRIMTEAERRQVVEQWNATEVAYATDVCLHELIASQAARTPDAVALAFDHRPTTTDHRPPTTEGERGRGGDGEREASDRRPPALNSQFSILNSRT